MVAARRPTWQRALHPVRRTVARVDWLNRRLPWKAWCAVGAADALTVAWVLATRSARPLRFVQIGANDGIIHDPIHQVVETCGWSGVLVEPLPVFFEKLVANYAGVPNLEFENAAIGTTDGTATIYSVDPRPGDPYWVELLSSFNRDVILSQGEVLPDVEHRLIEVEVKTTTLASLVTGHGLTTIDLLHVDAEGYDFEILKQIDFSALWAPSFIIFEREHFDREMYRQATRMLRKAGYRCVDVWPDTLAYRHAPRSGPQASPPREQGARDASAPRA
jgi:FkbM family methyltransferase